MDECGKDGDRSLLAAVRRKNFFCTYRRKIIEALSESSSDGRYSKRAKTMDECGKDGRWYFFGANSRGSCRRAIRMSRFISEAQKLRLLEQERHGDSHVLLSDRAVAVAKSIQKHRNLMLLEEERHRLIKKEIHASDGTSHVRLHNLAFDVSICIQKCRNLRGEGGPFFRTDMRLVTAIRFGQPIIRSFSEMFSEYYRRRYGVYLEVVGVQSYSCKGPIVTFDCAQRVRLFHVNFTATIKDDDDGGSLNEYCAVLTLFSFRLAPLLCEVVDSFPVDSNGSGNSCPCSFESPDSKIRHPRLETHDCNYAAKLVSTFGSLYFYDMLLQIFGLEGGFSSSSKIITKEPRDLPMPKRIMLLEGKRKGTGLGRLKELASDMAQCVENYGKPRVKEPRPGWQLYGLV